jgi:hypothetical protein
MAGHIASKVGSELNNHLEQHFFSESKKYASQTANSAINSTITDTVYNAHDLDKVRDNVDLLKSQVMNHPDLRGASSDTMLEKMQETTSKAYTGSIMQLVDNGNIGLAKQLRDEAFDAKGLTGLDLNHIDKSLKTAKDDLTAITLANKAADAHPGDLRAQYALRDKWAGGNPELYKSMTTFLDRRDHERELAIKTAEEGLVKSGAAYLVKAQNEHPDAGTDYFEYMPPSMKSQLQARPDLMKKTEALANPPPETDWGVKAQLEREMQVDPQKFAKKDLSQYWPYLNYQDRDRLFKYQQDIDKKDEKTMTEIEKMRGDKVTRDTVAITAGLRPDAKNGTSNKTNYDNYGRLGAEYVRQESARLGRPLSPKEQEDQFKKAATKVTIDGVLWDSNVPIYKFTDISKIPKADVELLKKKFAEKGRAWSDETGLRAWKLWKLNETNANK